MRDPDGEVCVLSPHSATFISVCIETRSSVVDIDRYIQQHIGDRSVQSLWDCTRLNYRTKQPTLHGHRSLASNAMKRNVTHEYTISIKCHLSVVLSPSWTKKKKRFFFIWIETLSFIAIDKTRQVLALCIRPILHLYYGNVVSNLDVPHKIWIVKRRPFWFEIQLCYRSNPFNFGLNLDRH